MMYGRGHNSYTLGVQVGSELTYSILYGNILKPAELRANICGWIFLNRNKEGSSLPQPIFGTLIPSLVLTLVFAYVTVNK